MKRRLVFLVIAFWFFTLPIVVTDSEAFGLKSRIIGKWVEVKNDGRYGDQIEFLKDGTVIVGSVVGDYKFIDDNRLRLDVKGIFGSGAMVFEVSIDKEGQLILTDSAGSVGKHITKAEMEKRVAAKRAEQEKREKAARAEQAKREAGARAELAKRKEKCIFSTNRDGNNEIYAMNIDGTNQARLTTNSASDTEPVWLPDGTKIAFVSNRDGNGEIYIMNGDGTNQT
ncbi:MAG: PD40 domain-containing protein, partial [Deltaproteobacteria bacterium]|nr:PD40 domain-containing protein [Deltaproteobacteria bacterium]